MIRRAMGVVLPAALCCTLVACGGDTAESYCGVVKEHRKEFNEMVDAGSQYGLITHLPMLEELADAAPRDLVDEWQLFLGAVKQLTQAVDATGHEVEDFADGAVPEDLSDAERSAITEAADRLASDDTLAASQGIDTQARDVCKVNLGR